MRTTYMRFGFSARFSGHSASPETTSTTKSQKRQFENVSPAIAETIRQRHQQSRLAVVIVVVFVVVAVVFVVVVVVVCGC